VNLDFLKLPSDERRLYIEQAAIRRNISPVIMEKDFFVCWLLNILFKSQFADSLVFKGGTSLSKIFGAISRFSEDIDLSLSPTFLGLPELRRDYQLMRDMYLNEPISFDVILRNLSDLEQHINLATPFPSLRHVS
jgi:predicted nucleotidyltransferase component of viral defense system